MKIFIQGRKDGYNTLYPKPTPAEFFQFAADIQRIDAQNNAQYYGKSFYSIAFNGTGCLFTKYIVGYDTLRKNLGNIGITIFIPSNEKMSGADIKSLLDELINIYTTNYCPDFKINNQKQEDWLLFKSAANRYKFEKKSLDENYQYGSKDAAYHFYNNTTEIEKYLDAPYQKEFKDRKQVFFIQNQSLLVLDIIKHDQATTANLTDTIEWDNPQYTLKDYRERGTNGVSIEIRVNNKLLHNNDTIRKKDDLYIKYSKKYHEDIIKKGTLSDPEIKQYLKNPDNSNSISLEENPTFTPIVVKVDIRIIDSKGKPIIDTVIVCKCKNNNSLPNKELSQNQNTIVFSGEEQKEKWTISDKRDNFKGERDFTPEIDREVALTLKEFKTIKLKFLDENNDVLKTEDFSFAVDDFEKNHYISPNIQSYPQKVPYTPKDIETDTIKLEKQVNQTQTTQGPKGGGFNSDTGQKPPRKRPYIKILIASSIACILVVGVYFLVGVLWDSKGADVPPQPKTVTQLTSTEIERYVEGDSLFLDKLNNYKEEWAKLKDSTDRNVYAENKDFIDRAIKKREAINSRDFVFFKDSSNAVRYETKQLDFKNAVLRIDKSQYQEVKTKLRDVSQLTLTQIADSINKILTTLVSPEDTKPSTEKNITRPNKGDTKQNENKLNTATNNQKTKREGPNTEDDEVEETPEKKIIEYLKGNELKGSELRRFQGNPDILDKLKKSINLALEFWSLNGDDKTKKTYFSYKSKVQKDPYLVNNSELIIFLNSQCQLEMPKYPNGKSGAGTTLTLKKFIEQAK